MSDLKINNITNRGGNGGPVISGVSTVATSAFMVIPSGDTAIRGAGSGRGIIAGGAESLSSPYTISDRMQYITISTTGNAIDFGDLSLARYCLNLVNCDWLTLRLLLSVNTTCPAEP